MVEFTLVAPMFFVLFVGLVDGSRGLLAYNEISVGSRAGAREAVLQYNAGSNSSSPACYPATCNVPGVVPMITRVGGFGFPVVYNDSGSSSAPTSPSACTATPNDGLGGRPLYAANGSVPPLTLGLGPTAAVNTIYVCTYEYDPTSASTTGFWATSTGLARAGGHQMAVVDLKVKWASIALSLLGFTPSVTLDSQTIQRIEY